ncbi:MAG TPA: hemolysin family protein, partial [Gemmatimonadaceae bacterium]|nr:hemolysin family protein [Gemmatimonadaceae bacterium]
MMAAIVVALGAFVVAATLEMADGALLVTHTDHDRPDESDVARAERERTHRALSMASVALYLGLGAAIAVAAPLDALGPIARPLVHLLLALVVVGAAEAAARAIGQAQSHAVLQRAAPVMRSTVWLLTPATALGALLEHWLHALLPVVAPDQEDRETTEEQFREVVAAEAEISSAEAALIHGAFSMGETEVREIMVPRVDIVGIDATTPWSEVVDRVRSSEHARLPVYDGTLDNIIGVLYAKDLLGDIIADTGQDDDWRRLLRRAAIIPPSKRIDAQLKEFQSSRTHIAIVVDEYGGTAGLVTIEDILEEIVGEIHDEYDVAEPEIRQEGMTRFWVAGRVSVADLMERLDVDFGIHDVTTGSAASCATCSRWGRARSRSSIRSGSARSTPPA